jgi:heptosyltransferase-2
VVSALDACLELAYALGCPPEPKRMELAVTPNDVQQAEQIWQEFGLTKYSRVILLNLGSANGTARHWPLEHYLALCSRLASDAETGILVICGPAEEDTARKIEAAMGHPQVKSMAGQDLGLGVSKACIARASLMVSPDSGPRHIAAAFNVPTITLSGPIHPLVGANYHPDAIVLHEQLPCQPCGLDACPIEGHPCMRNLTPERVHAEILHLLQRQAQQAA